MRHNVNDLDRAASVAVGLLLIAATRRTRGRALAAALGAGLMARGVSGFCPITAAFRGNRNDTREDGLISLKFESEKKKKF